jgi:hypothetical protein
MVSSENIRWCFSWREGPYSLNPARRGVMLLDTKWTWDEGQSREIHLAFLPGQGSAKLRSRVKEAANRWTEQDAANIRFVWRDDPAFTAVRISFQPGGSW